MRALTVKQQTKHRARAFRLLPILGFKVDGPPQCRFYWLDVGRRIDGERLCVAFDVPDQCLGGRTGWVWQKAKLTEAPLFGYSGTTSVGSAWATCDRIIAVTLEQIASIGFVQGLLAERVKLTEIKTSLASTLAKI
jgi:hypothetical protein